MYKDVIKDLEVAQETEMDNRDLVVEADRFVNIRGAQWEQNIITAWDGRPRYSFDMCSPVIDSIMSDMEESSFGIDILPTGGKSSKEIAEKYEGLIRNIENISGARFIYNNAARVMCSSGLGGWRIKQAYRDSDSFQQDLIIDSISNFAQRVWFDAGAIKQTMEDANDCWVLTELSMDKYNEEFPEGSKASVGQAMRDEILYNKKDGVVIGEWLHKKEYMKELALLSNNQIVVVDENFNTVRDEMFAKGVTVVQTRKRKSYKVYQRLFDGHDFLSDDMETVFEFIPVIPTFGNYTIMENKIIYYGIIEKLMDPQRVLNYAESKKIAESALKPIDKTWMTTEQAKGSNVIKDLETQNTNNKPIQLYKHVEGHLPPFKPTAVQPDSVLIETAQTAGQFIDKAANLYDASKGAGLAGQSGETVRLLQNKGSAANYKYFKSMEVAIQHTARILVKAIPKVYDTKQELRIINEDGTTENFVVGEQILDEQTKQIVTINDISKGTYDVVVKSGPAYYTKQQDTVNNILQAAAIDPTIVQVGADVLLNNIPSPGMSKIAARKRKQLFNGGFLTKDQLTEEEQAEVDASKQQQPQPDPNMIIAEAELVKAQADTVEAENSRIELKLKAHQADVKNQLDLMKLQNDRMELQISAKKAGMDLAKTQAETAGIKLDNKEKILDIFTKRR